MSLAEFPKPSQLLGSLIDEARQTHIDRYGIPPETIVASPGRVNLIGEHIDYNDGFVMPMAIERYVVMTASLKQHDESSSQPDHATLFSQGLSDYIHVSLIAPPQQGSGGWANYVEGVISGFKEQTDRTPACSIPAFNAVVLSNVPVGGGLSSSAALEVATATLLETLTGHVLKPAEKAVLCQQAEHRFAGVPCGVMDQFSSVFGKPNELMLLDCQSNQIQAIPFADESITVLITNSCVKHELTGGEYADRRRQCDEALAEIGMDSWRGITMVDVESAKQRLTDEQYRRGRHVVSEIQRTQQAAIAFANASWSQLGSLMYASHESLRDDFEVSCHELDDLVAIARSMGESCGVIGSRMTGGGFGGCTVTLVQSDRVDDVRENLLKEYERRTGIRGEAFTSRPALGSHVFVTKR